MTARTRKKSLRCSLKYQNPWIEARNNKKVNFKFYNLKLFKRIENLNVLVHLNLIQNNQI